MEKLANLPLEARSTEHGSSNTSACFYEVTSQHLCVVEQKHSGHLSLLKLKY